MVNLKLENVGQSLPKIMIMIYKKNGKDYNNKITDADQTLFLSTPLTRENANTQKQNYQFFQLFNRNEDAYNIFNEKKVPALSRI